jgi:hypothetical protein
MKYALETISTAIAAARQHFCNTTETFVGGMLVLFISRQGFEQTRLLLWTDQRIIRVKYDFFRMIPEHW